MSISSILQGGLGNQMFIVASSLGISEKLGMKYLVSRDCFRYANGDTVRLPYWDSVFHTLPYVDSAKIPLPQLVMNEPNSNVKLNGYEYIPDHIKHTQHIYLQGYFQSSYYFKHLGKKLLDYFSLPENDCLHISLKMKELREKYNNKKINFIHVRHGDYLKLQHFHIVLSERYYENALKHFDQENDVFLIFSDDQEWCKNIFSRKLNHVEYISEKDYIEMFIMSECDGGIIANSSFSWWGAYLMNLKKEETKNKVVCPDIWFMDRFPQREMRNESEWNEEKVII